MTTAPPTTASPNCSNSFDSRCGPFRWDPEPDNQPLVVEISVITGTPKVGEPVQFRSIADDPDMQIDDYCVGMLFGDNKDPYCIESSPSCPVSPTAYGTWTPPTKNPDRVERVISHTYDAPGTYTASFTFRSVNTSCASPNNPYYSVGTGTVTFTVLAS